MSVRNIPSEIFKVDEGRLLPGNSWATAINVARHHDRWLIRDRHDLYRIGVALSGAASVLGSVELDLSDFTNIAKPPMNEAEANEFQRGYDRGNFILGNGIGYHISDVPAGEVVS